MVRINLYSVCVWLVVMHTYL